MSCGNNCSVLIRLNELQKQLYELANTVANLKITSLKKSFLSGTIINGGKAVIVDTDKKIYPYDINNSYHYDKYAGIAEGSAAGPMEPVVVIMEGISTVIGSNWIPGVGYYIGSNSLLTPIPPSSGMVKQVGVGVDTNTIIVNDSTEVISI